MSITTHDSIRKIATEAPSRSAFFQAFLRYAGSQTNALSGIAWNCSTHPFQPISQIQSRDREVLRIGISESDHQLLLKQSLAVKTGKPLVSMPKPNSAGQVPSENPVIMMGAVRGAGTIEVIELFFPQGLESRVYQECSETLEALCSAAGECELPINATNAPVRPLGMQPLDQPNMQGISDLEQSESVKKISPSQLDEYVHQLHRSLDRGDTAKQIANEARRVLDCDRVSVLITKGKRCKVTAVSGQASVNNRSNTVHLLRKFVQRVLPTRQEFWYPAENQLPPEIENPLQEYLAIAATRSLIVVPIYDRPPEFLERPDPIKVKKRIIGGMVIEHCGEEWTRSTVSNAVDVVTRHAADAFRNSHNHQQLLFYSVWKWLGKSKVVFAARNLSKTVAVAIGLIAATLALIFMPANFKVSCEGMLVPKDRSNVFAPAEGTVSEIAVAHGSIVKKGDTLVSMVNIALETQAAELKGKIVEREQEILSTEMLLLSRDTEEQQLGEQNLNAQKAELKSFRRQLDLVNRKLEKLNVTSPRDGQVITWNVEERFRMRPLSRGELLMEVVDVDGEWQLELNLPDQKIGHLLKAYEKNDRQALEVEFILAADPERKLKGKLVDIGNATVMIPEQGQSVRLKVEIENEQLDIRQAKSGVSANVICGKTSLGYSLFHGVKEFVQKQWFKLL
ncbi:MAG: HlyD family efflux transporter periplasmic adaptor subunit [Mariniblastus sp.]